LPPPPAKRRSVRSPLASRSVTPRRPLRTALPATVVRPAEVDGVPPIFTVSSPQWNTSNADRNDAEASAVAVVQFQPSKAMDALSTSSIRQDSSRSVTLQPL